MTTTAILLALAAAASGAAGPPRSAATAPEERVTVRRVRVPVVLDPRPGGSCDALDPAWAEVSEDGVPAEVARLERSRTARATADVLVSPTLHVLLFDTSASMAPRAQDALAAARAYVAALAPGEAVMLATFDDRLMLVREPTVDLAAVAEGIDRLGSGRGTVLWRSLDEVLGYLDAYPGRKVVAMVTDGCDSLYPAGPAPLDVVHRAARTAETTFFPIALDAPQRCPGSFPLDPLVPLRRLASGTGGECFEIRTADQLGSRLDRIRARLEREAWLTYVPPESPASTDPARERRIRVRSAGDAPCDVRLAASSIRVEGNAAADRDGGFVETGDGISAVATVLEGGAVREVRALLPPLVFARRADDPFAEVLETLSASADAARDRPPFVVDGATLLDLLPDLAAALDTRPDYRAWARERIARRRVGLLEGVADPDDPALAGYRTWLASGDWEPRAAERTAVLGAWLEDLDAAAVAAAVDRRLATRSLRSGTSADEIEARFATLRAWLEPGGDGTAIGFLVPAHDPAADVFGFRRVTVSLEGRDVAVPRAPIATRLAAFVAAAVDGPAPEIRAARYHAASRAEARALARATGTRIDRGRLAAVSIRVGIDGVEESVVGWFREVGRGRRRAVETRPFAWAVEPDGAVGRWLREPGGPADATLVALPRDREDGEDGS